MNRPPRKPPRAAPEPAGTDAPPRAPAPRVDTPRVPTPRAAAPVTRPPFIAERLEATVARLEATIARLQADTPDPEAVHDVRVASRRLRGGIAAAGDLGVTRGKTKRISRRLKALRAGLGGARQAEVGLDLLGTLRARMTAEERTAAGVLAGLLGRDLARFRAGLPDTVRRLELGRLVREARALAGRLDTNAARTARPGGHPPEDADDLQRRAVAAVQSRHRALVDLPPGPLGDLDDAALHRFRIEAKKLRYTLEFLAPLLAGAESRIEKLREIQDLVGALHDLADLAGLAGDLGSRAREAGYEATADSFARLAARLERRRRRDGRGFRPLREVVTGERFLAGLGVAGRSSRSGRASAGRITPDRASSDRERT